MITKRYFCKVLGCTRYAAPEKLLCDRHMPPSEIDKATMYLGIAVVVGAVVLAWCSVAR